MRKYWLETYGCQMNKAESGALEEQLLASGWETAAADTEADLVIINTCSVRKTAENRIWGRLGHFKHLKMTQSVTVALMGCMAERLKEEAREESDAIDMLVGTFGKKDFIKALTESGEDNPLPAWSFFGSGEYEFNESHTLKNEFQAQLPIMHGCNNFCTYCIVPYVRGREVSRDPDSIRKEIIQLSKQGVREVTLLGQNVNSYSWNDGEMNFPQLLHYLKPFLGEIEWVRFMSSHPKDLTEETITALVEIPQMCHNIHLAVQHGSNKILKAMNRRYTREHFLELTDKIKRSLPQVSLTTDLLIGFPGETEADLQDTLDLMNQVKFDDAFMYHYNPREGTKSVLLPDQLEDSVKKERLNRVIMLQQEITLARMNSYVGREEKVLVEGFSRKNKNEMLGRTERNEMVVFPGDESLIGQFCHIRLLSLEGRTYKGEKV